VSDRNTDRAKKRVVVRYGIGKPDKTAFTKNLSEDGLCLQTNNVFRPGTTIQIQVGLPDDETYNMWARVIWARKVPAQLAHVQPCGMGLQIIDPDPAWIRAVAKWLGRTAPAL